MASLKNSEVLNQYQSAGQTQCITFIMQEHSLILGDSSSLPSRPAYVKKVQAFHKQFLILRKNKSREDGQENVEQFLNADFNFPAKGAAQGPVSSQPGVSSPFQQAALHGEKQAFMEELQHYKPENATLQHKVDELQRTKKNLRVRKERCQQHKAQLQEVKTQVRALTRHNKVLQRKLRIRYDELKRHALRVKYLSKKSIRWKQKAESLIPEKAQMEQECSILTETLHHTQAEVNDTVAENDWLREMVQDEIPTRKEDGNFTDDMRMCVYELLSLNVSTGQISEVIETVLKLSHQKASHLPSKSTIKDWNISRLHLAHAQVAQQLPQVESLCLLSDETSKYGKKYEGFHVSDEQGRIYVLGLTDIASKSSQDVLGTFQEILQDIDDVSADEQNSQAKEILVRIRSTMSDRASTHLKFNELLEEFRKTVLPEAWTYYDQLSEAAQLSIGRLCNFFCGLHVLVHLAETASTSLLEAQQGFFEDPPVFDRSFQKPSEPGTTRLVRTSCKAVAAGGDEKSGCYDDFYEYMRPTLEAQRIHSLPLERFRGNRFNILFKNTAGVFFLSDHLATFLQANAENRLLKAVLKDLQTPEYVAGCKALGLVSYLVTVPLWSCIEDSNIHVMDIGTRYQETITYLTDRATNPERFMTAQDTLTFCNINSLRNDPIFNKLLQPWEYDEKVEVILRIMLPAMTRLLQRVFIDHLPGGKWDDPSPDLRQQTRGIPKHNKYSESVFGHLDRLMKEKPNITSLASEAYIMFSRNSTIEWLQACTEHERAVLIKNARVNVKKLREKFKARQDTIKQSRRAAVLEKMRKAEEIQARRLQRKERQTANIIYWGLWQSDQQVDDALATITTNAQKVKALKAQLSFRQNVLKQKPEDRALRDVYAFSKVNAAGRRVSLKPAELTVNVKRLIHHAYSIHVPQQARGDDDQGVPLLVCWRIKHAFEYDGEETWFLGEVISQVGHTAFCVELEFTVGD